MHYDYGLSKGVVWPAILESKMWGGVWGRIHTEVIKVTSFFSFFFSYISMCVWSVVIMSVILCICKIYSLQKNVCEWYGVCF